MAIPLILDTDTAQDASAATAQIGLWGVLMLIFRSYSLGAGTYTGGDDGQTVSARVGVTF